MAVVVVVADVADVAADVAVAVGEAGAEFFDV